ncbi:fluoride efflux transporter FluC [Streptomyces sp. NPDC048639]|uniref:fluoride efflux transporter FluC n=1 Tax=Streptomyces sp. NPDC048639 TaxID=3365581 RepID=UPI0037103A38
MGRAVHGASAATAHRGEPVDPDVDLHVPADRAETAPHRLWQVLAVIAAGGAAGASARYGASLAWPTPRSAFPWDVFWVNVSGCTLIGVLMVLVSERGAGHPLLRPFLSTGVLGGYTTFSTYAVDLVGLLRRGEAGVAVAYAVGTLTAALGAVWAAAALTRAVFRGESRPGGDQPERKARKARKEPSR